MSIDYISKDVIFINSSYRTSGTSSNFSIDITQQVKPNNNYDMCALINFSCPKSYYMFNSSNNVFIVNENGSLTTITITAGTYSPDTIITELLAKLSACLYTYSITSNDSLGKFVFTVSGNAGIQPIFDFSGLTSPYYILGFEKEIYTFSGNSLTSPNVYDLQLTNNIQLLSNLVDKSVISTIVPNNPDFSSIQYTEFNPSFTSVPLVGIGYQTANFYLVDGDTGLPLDLNGQNFSFTLVFYKKNDSLQKLVADKALELALLDLKRIREQ